jgi:hypothetical protein
MYPSRRLSKKVWYRTVPFKLEIVKTYVAAFTATGWADAAWAHAPPLIRPVKRGEEIRAVLNASSALLAAKDG